LAGNAKNELPAYAFMRRDLEPGLHRLVDVFPHIKESPAVPFISPSPPIREVLLDSAMIDIREFDGYAYIDVNVPCIVLAVTYYRQGDRRDIYLDLLHETTHLRQLAEGKELWDRSLAYVDRPTEIEGYAVAVREGRRLGMTEEDVIRHLTSPWLTTEDVYRLLANVEAYLGEGAGRV
jgi:hypothetical protein